MYKNASGLRKFDEWDLEETEKFQSAALAAAGVQPRASDLFILCVKTAIRFSSINILDHVKLANWMNVNGRYNTNGQLWNHLSVRAFIRAFLSQSN